MKNHYNKYSQYLKNKYGCGVYKVSIDAGFLCPNQDGTLSNEGCIYCDNMSFSFNTRTASKTIEQQIEDGIKFGKTRYKAEKFIVYFQAHTNTYAGIDELKRKYDKVKNYKNIVGISIGTRPDFISREILDLIKTYNSMYDIWLEYGLQSIHDKTLKFINRNHSYADFAEAIKLTKEKDIKICAHIIIGLPGEDKDDMLATVKRLTELKIDAVKIHPLYVVKGTKLSRLYGRGECRIQTKDEFIETVSDALKYLSPDIVIQRIGADCPREILVHPEWIHQKKEILELVDEKLEKENCFQGCLL